jgi:hypothetical protein
MHPVARTAIAIVIVLCGVLLTAVFVFNATQGASVLNYAKAVVSVLVTVRLLLWLRQDQVPKKDQPGAISSGRNTKMIALGLAVGLGLPLVIVWLITSGNR